MRKTLSVVIIYQLILLSMASIGHAGELTEYRKNVEQNFRETARAMFLNMVSNYFNEKVVNIYETAEILSLRLKNKSASLNECLRSLEINKDNEIIYSFKLKECIDRSQSLSGYSSIVKNDLSILENTWKNRCSGESLDYAKKYFTPKTKLDGLISRIDMTNIANEGWSAHLDISASNNGNMQAIPSVGNHSQGAAESDSSTIVGAGVAGGAAAYTTMTMGSSAAVAFGTAIGATGVGLVVVGAAVACMAILSMFGNHTIRDNIEDANAIMNFQLNAIDEESRNAISNIEIQCQIIMKDENSSSGKENLRSFELEKMKSHAEEVLFFANDKEKSLQLEYNLLKIEDRNKIENLLKNNFEITIGHFLSGLQKEKNEAKAYDQKINAFIVNHVVPSLEQYFKSKKSSIYSQLLQKDNIWNLIIEGDARLGILTDRANERPTKWSAVRAKLYMLVTADNGVPSATTETLIKETPVVKSPNPIQESVLEYHVLDSKIVEGYSAQQIALGYGFSDYVSVRVSQSSDSINSDQGFNSYELSKCANSVRPLLMNVLAMNYTGQSELSNTTEELVSKKYRFIEKDFESILCNKWMGHFKIRKLQPVEELKLLTALADNTEENQRIILTDLISYYHQNSLLKNNAIAETIFKTHLFGALTKGKQLIPIEDLFQKIKSSSEQNAKNLFININTAEIEVALTRSLEFSRSKL